MKLESSDCATAGTDDRLPAVLFKLAIQSCLTDPKQAGCLELVVIDDFQGVGDGLFLHSCERNNLPGCAFARSRSLSSLTTFNALTMACFSRVARGTIFRAAPVAREAGAFFLLDLRICRLVLAIL